MSNKTFSLIIIAVLLIIGAYAAIALILTFGGAAYFTIGSSSGQQPTPVEEWSSVGIAPPAGESCSEPGAVAQVDGKFSYNGISLSVDPSLANSLVAWTCAALPLREDLMPAEAHPPYTAFHFPMYSRPNTDFQPEVRVYEVTGGMQDYAYPLNMLVALQAEVTQRPEPVTWFNGAPLHSRQSYISFANGSGVRGIVQYMQDRFFYTNNGLIYEFNGLTQDSRYFVSVRFPLDVPFLMELSGSDPLTNLNPQAIAIPGWPNDYQLQAPIVEVYNSEALRRLEQMSDQDALPNIALLDALVQSIQVNNP